MKNLFLVVSIVAMTIAMFSGCSENSPINPVNPINPVDNELSTVKINIKLADMPSVKNREIKLDSIRVSFGSSDVRYFKYSPEGLDYIGSYSSTGTVDFVFMVTMENGDYLYYYRYANLSCLPGDTIDLGDTALSSSAKELKVTGTAPSIIKSLSLKTNDNCGGILSYVYNIINNEIDIWGIGVSKGYNYIFTLRSFDAIDTLGSLTHYGEAQTYIDKDDSNQSVFIDMIDNNGKMQTIKLNVRLVPYGTLGIGVNFP